MYRELDEEDMLLMKKVEKITGTNYEIKNNSIDIEQLLNAIQDLVCEVGRLEEELEDLQNDVRDNYKRVENREFYDIYDDMFI